MESCKLSAGLATSLYRLWLRITVRVPCGDACCPPGAGHAGQTALHPPPTAASPSELI